MELESTAAAPTRASRKAASGCTAPLAGAAEVWYVGELQHQQAGTLACECAFPQGKGKRKTHKPTNFHIIKAINVARANDRAGHCFC